MKPVFKGDAPGGATTYKSAKPHLIARLGEHCSYCEAHRDPQDLHVEHIYPQKPHPERENDWENFLVACSTCNSYKNIRLGNQRRRRLEDRYLWPHLDNTFRAYKYLEDGRVDLRPRLQDAVRKAADATRNMVGLTLTPAKVAKYRNLGIAYDGIDKRREQWSITKGLRSSYLKKPSRLAAERLARAAVKMGYFSIWMELFRDRIEVRRELIRAFRADPSCFDIRTKPRKKSRL